MAIMKTIILFFLLSSCKVVEIDRPVYTEDEISKFVLHQRAEVTRVEPICQKFYTFYPDTLRREWTNKERRRNGDGKYMYVYLSKYRPIRFKLKSYSPKKLP